MRFKLGSTFARKSMLCMTVMDQSLLFLAIIKIQQAHSQRYVLTFPVLRTSHLPPRRLLSERTILCTGVGRERYRRVKDFFKIFPTRVSHIRNSIRIVV